MERQGGAFGIQDDGHLPEEGKNGHLPRALLALLEILSQVATVSFTERNGDPQLLQILLQCFPAQIDLAGSEESPNVLFEFRRA